MNLQIALALVSSAIFLVAECRRNTKDDLTQAQDVVRSLPESERPEFMAYSLGHGFMEQYRIESTEQFPFPTLLKIPKKLEKKFKALDKPENFTSDLYQFVQSSFRLKSSDMFALILRRKICLPRGRCIDLENIGELCCPF